MPAMRSVWVLVLIVALVGSNLAWLLGSGTTAVPAPDIDDALAMRIAELEDELCVARAAIAEHESAVAAARQRRSADTATLAGGDDAAAVEAAQRAAAAEQRARMQRMRKLYDGWVQDALQTADPGLRAAALNSLEAALRSGDPTMVAAALAAFARLRELDFDKARFRGYVLDALRSEDAAVRARALTALGVTGTLPGDLELVLGFVADDSPEVRSGLTHQLMRLSDNRLEGAAADAVLRLLGDADEDVRRMTLNGLWGARPDERIVERLIAMTADRERRHDAIYFGLSTFQQKSSAVVAALVSALTDPNFEVAGRADWGLGYGVDAADRAVVADAYLRLLETRSGAQWRERCLRRLGQYGTAAHVPGLEGYAARPGLDENARFELQRLIAQLRQR